MDIATRLDTMKNYSEFTYWFTPESDCRYDVWDQTAPNSSRIGTILSVDGKDELCLIDLTKAAVVDEIQEAFNSYKTRPEYFVCNSAEISGLLAKSDVYETVVVGCAFIRAHRNGKNPDTCKDSALKVCEHVRKGDFYTSPASTQYHESYVGGLLDHTLKVIVETIKLHVYDKFRFNVSIDSAVLCAAVHDWCKIGNYESYQRNVKDESGNWVQVDAFKRKGEPLPLGHGVSSLYHASQCFKLTFAEAAAIRWHMGAWRVLPEEMNELQSSNETYPLVHLIQFADQMSIVNY